MSADKITQSSLVSTLLNGHQRSDLETLASTPMALLEQYKLYVEMADRVSARRLTANSFFLTLNSAIITVGGYAALRFDVPLPPSIALAAALAGVTLCLVWHRLLASYRDLNTAKFKVIHEIEKLLPLSPYDAEWQAVGRGSDPEKYLPLTHLEVIVPWVFLVLHLGAFLGPLI
jgi:hypothetical protein